MPQVLGIDLGARHTVMAVCPLDPTEPAGPRVLAMGPSAGVPSGLDIGAAGTVTCGSSVTGFVARVGDPVPVVVDGQPYPAHDLAAVLVACLVNRATALLGEEPRHTVLTHPAGWGARRLGSLRQSLHRQGLDALTLVPAPVAAAHAWAASAPVAVLDLAADPVEAVVVAPIEPPPASGPASLPVPARASGPVPGPASRPASSPVPGPASASVSGDPHRRFRVAGPVMTADPDPGDRSDSAGHSGRFDGPGRSDGVTGVGPAAGTEPWPLVEALVRAAHAGGTRPAAVVLTGVSALLPAVAQLVGRRLGTPVLSGPDPAHTVAVGAALAALTLVATPDVVDAATPAWARPPALHRPPPTSTGTAPSRQHGEPDHAVGAASFGSGRAAGAVSSGREDGSDQVAGAVSSGREGGPGQVVGAVSSRPEVGSGGAVVRPEVGPRPARPPVDIEPPDLDPPRSLVRSMVGRPLVLAGTGAVAAAGVALTLMLMPGGPGQPERPTPSQTSPPAAEVPQPMSPPGGGR